jgi:hypothetical protein
MISSFHPNFKNLTGKRFGRWTVLSHVPTGRKGSSTWRCQCDCGRIKENVFYTALTTGKSLSCGCLRTDLLRGKAVDVKPESQTAVEEPIGDLAELEAMLVDSKKPVVSEAKKLILNDQRLWRCIARCRVKGLTYKGQKPTDFYVKLAQKDELAIWLRG